jgi:hypothetical protein
VDRVHFLPLSAVENSRQPPAWHSSQTYPKRVFPARRRTSRTTSPRCRAARRGNPPPAPARPAGRRGRRTAPALPATPLRRNRSEASTKRSRPPTSRSGRRRLSASSVPMFLKPRPAESEPVVTLWPWPATTNPNLHNGRCVKSWASVRCLHRPAHTPGFLTSTNDVAVLGGRIPGGVNPGSSALDHRFEPHQPRARGRNSSWSPRGTRK